MPLENLIHQYKEEKRLENLDDLEEELYRLENELAYIKEEILDLVSNWFSDNEIEPDCVLNEVQKNLLNYMLYPIRTHEKMLEIEIKMCLIKVRESQKELN